MLSDAELAFRVLAKLVLDDSVPSDDLDRSLRSTAENALLKWLGQTKDPVTDRELLVLLTAVALSPRDAVAYDIESQRPRWKIIAEHIANLSFAGEVAGQLELISRHIATVLDDWTEERAPGRGVRRLKMERCAICRVNPSESPRSLATRDPYKPYHEAPDELLRLEVDHITPVALSGTRRPSNFQIVCRACNLAKSAVLEISAMSELQYSASTLTDVPRAHRFRMLQWVLTHRGRSCADCTRDDCELTVRPLDSRMTYMRPNLKAVCYNCARDAAY